MSAYEEALKSDKSNVQVAKEFGRNESTVRRARKRLGIVSTATPGPPASTFQGESETHSEDGSSSYVRFSQEPWGHDDYRDFIRSKGQDPDKVTFTWGWTSNPAGGFWNKLNNVRPVSGSDETYPLDHLYAEAQKVSRPEREPSPGDRTLVVALADWQLGKTGRRGGTAETLARLAQTREKLADIYGEGEYDEIILFDLGDGIEGFESGGDPQFTNDLSLPDQLDAYSTELFKFVNQAEDYADTIVAAVPSNHSAWRRGKQSLGRPSDDFGLYAHREVAKVAHAAGLETRWVFPEEYDESVAVTAKGGAVIGGVHGNQFGPGKAIDWWQAQAFGSQAVTQADVLLTGHYHSFGAGVAGKNPASGRERYWFGAPTVDNGSDWYRNLRGRDSETGTLIFEVDGNGFDLGGLRII